MVRCVTWSVSLQMVHHRVPAQFVAAAVRASQKRFWLDLNPAAVIPVACTLTQALIAIGELTGASRKATARQIETLVKAKVLAEDDEELDQLTKAEASKLIGELFAK